MSEEISTYRAILKISISEVKALASFFNVCIHMNRKCAEEVMKFMCDSHIQHDMGVFKKIMEIMEFADCENPGDKIS